MKKEKKMIWLLTGIAAVSLLVLCTVVIVRTATYPFIRTTGPDGPPRSVEPSAQAVERLAGGIRIPTVSDAIDRTDDNPFQAFKAYLPQAYPAIYSRLDTLTINEYGLVFRWPGKNPALPPILLCSHYDVVPVLNYDPSAPDAPLPGWDYPPFSGAVADGRIYGRGTLDMKGMLFSILEATDSLLAEGFRPERDVWIALGFDEETGGTQGALKIARYFEEQGIAFDAVYDEGGIIIAPGLRNPTYGSPRRNGRKGIQHDPNHGPGHRRSLLDAAGEGIARTGGRDHRDAQPRTNARLPDSSGRSFPRSDRRLDGSRPAHRDR